MNQLHDPVETFAKAQQQAVKPEVHAALTQVAARVTAKRSKPHAKWSVAVVGCLGVVWGVTLALQPAAIAPMPQLEPSTFELLLDEYSEYLLSVSDEFELLT